MARYRRWQNSVEPGQIGFVTTTVLDFNRVFLCDRRKDLMVEILREMCVRHEATLHAYVVMAHHVHFLVRCPDEHDISWLLQRIKSRSGMLIAATLDDDARSGFDQQRGLNDRNFWKKGFRSIVASDQATFWQKVNYIHQNPVRAGLCDKPEEYAWSSARMFEAGLWHPETGLPLPE